MARIRARDIPEGATEVPIPEATKSTLPHVKARREIMADPAKRTMMAEIMDNARMAMRMPKVRSNAELEQRIDEYFQMASKRRMPATIEELSLYCGYTSSTLNDWKLGRSRPFHDGEESGVTTSDIVKRAIEVLHTVDANLAETGAINTVAYIFRSKNYYGMQDKQEVTITPNIEQHTMSREQIEEIARNLPDASDTMGADGTVE